MKKSALAALLFACSLNAAAASPEARAALERMFAVTNMQSMLDAAYAQLDGMFDNLVRQMNVPPAKKPVIDKYVARLNRLMREELTWEKIKEPSIEIYAATYTVAEIEELVRFYQTPLGQKLLAKMPELMAATMQHMQGMLQTLMPKLQALENEMRRELAQ